MQHILTHINKEHLEWVQSMSPKDIANILNMVADIPNMKTKRQTERFAVNIGKDGEDLFENIIQTHLSKDYVLENTSKLGNTGDFILTWISDKTNKKYILMIDTKQYTNTVPTSEINKFYRDINNNVIHGGLLLSYNSKICGISKIIDLKNISTETGELPCVLANVKDPYVIVEIIKLIFHVIEIRDIHSNDIQNMDDLINQITQLNDNVEIISDCKHILYKTKSDIEKSLNDVIHKIMSCEYSLALKINAINKTLEKKCSLDHIITDYDIVSQETNQSIINTIVDSFSSYIKEDMLPYINAICNIKWNSTAINITTRTCSFTKTDTYTLKIFKGSLSFIVTMLTDHVQKILSELSKSFKKSIKYTTKGVEIKIDTNTISHCLSMID